MIVANELTDGRFVYRIFDSPKSDKDKEIICLAGVSSIYNTYVCEDGNIGSLIELEPIPLTDEVLELNCGFKTLPDSDDYAIGRFMVIKRLGKWAFPIEDKLVWLKSLHQLQNLYFALKGEELEIKNL